MKLKNNILQAVWHRSNRLTERLRRRFATRKIYGPSHIQLADDQVMIVALVRDAEWFLDFFIEYHLGLGVDHILIIDNGSIDNTQLIARSYENRITILQNNLPVKLHESALRSELAKRIAKGGWFLFVDSDELVELPAPIHHLTRYCNNYGYTAVLGQMLDRFSELSYSKLKYLNYREAVKEMKFYSLNNVESIEYTCKESVPFHWFLRNNSCDYSKGRLKRGGVRKELFGEDPFLSKHSLVRNRPEIIPMSHPHCASGIKVADVSILLNHFKLAGDWMARDKRTVQSAAWTHGEDARRLTEVGKNDDFRMIVAEPKVFQGIESLQKEGYLYVSENFMKQRALLQNSPERGFPRGLV